MKMPKPSEDAKAAFARVVPDGPAITIKPMFGQMSAFVNGNMFCGIFGEDFFVRLPEEEIAKVKKSGGRDFEPMAGHKMGGYVMQARSRGDAQDASEKAEAEEEVVKGSDAPTRRLRRRPPRRAGR